MSAKTRYRQCSLVKETETGSVRTVSHIPAKYAKIGRVLSLRGDDKTWTHGWKVETAGPIVHEPADPRDLIKGHRKMTGDSRPRVSA